MDVSAANYGSDICWGKNWEMCSRAHIPWGEHIITVTLDAKVTQDAKVTRHMECSC